MMNKIISWSQKTDLKQTDKVYGIKILHKGESKWAWFPKSQVININLETKIMEIPQWLYDKKMKDLFDV